MGSIYFIFAVRFKFLTDSMFSAHSLPSLMPLTEHLINVFTNWRKNHEKKTKLSRVLTHIWHYKINIEKTKGKTKKKNWNFTSQWRKEKSFRVIPWNGISFNSISCSVIILYKMFGTMYVYVYSAQRQLAQQLIKLSQWSTVLWKMRSGFESGRLNVKVEYVSGPENGRISLLSVCVCVCVCSELMKNKFRFWKGRGKMYPLMAKHPIYLNYSPPSTVWIDFINHMHFNSLCIQDFLWSCT